MTSEVRKSKLHMEPTFCPVLTGGHLTIRVPGLHHLLHPFDPLDNLLSGLRLLGDVALGVHSLAVGSVIIRETLTLKIRI